MRRIPRKTIPCKKIHSWRTTISKIIRSWAPKIIAFRGSLLCRRIARLNLWRCIVVILASDAKTPALERKTVRKHDSYEYFSFDWGRLLSPDSLAYAALMDPGVVQRSTISGRELFRKGGQREQWRMESIGFDNSLLERVVIMVMPE